MPVRVIEEQVQKSELSDLELKGRYAGLVKAVVDIKRAIMVAGGVTMHFRCRRAAFGTKFRAM